MEQLAKAVVTKLIEKNWRISFAESCTGGMAAAAIVDIPDASRVFDLSFVTYANEAKFRFVGVDPDAAFREGVVSETVAGQMAIGCAKQSHAQVGVGVSGIAGPTGGTDQKPVGTVCFGFWVDGSLYTKTCRFGNIGRNEVRKKSVEFIYQTLQHLLQK